MALDRSGSNDHRVRRTRFEIAGGSEAALMSLRAEVESEADGALAAAISSALDGAAGPDEVVEIGRLEVDLGRIGAGGFDFEALSGALRGAVAERLVAGAARSPGPAPDDAEPASEEVRRRSAPEAANAVLLRYLLTGGVGGAGGPRFRLGDLVAEVAAAPGGGAVAFSALAAAPDDGRRRAAALRLIAAAAPDTLSRLVGDAAPAALAALGGGAALTAEAERAKRSEAAAEALAAHLVAALRGEDQLIVPAPEPGAELSGAARTDRAAASAIADALADEEANDEADEAFGEAAANAGVVILHPFLPRLFERCGLIEGRDFRDDAARALAARLIHYLATGEPEAEEVALTVPRLLAALKPATPALALSRLNPEWLESADGLLTAAIDHWKGLGRASPAALRETFLTRPGVLRGSPRRRTIVVERRGVDILIRSLPWSLTMVAAPWLPAPIRVDWA